MDFYDALEAAANGTKHPPKESDSAPDAPKTTPTPAEDVIAYLLTATGGNRWTKQGKDRIYFGGWNGGNLLRFSQWVATETGCHTPVLCLMDPKNCYLDLSTWVWTINVTSTIPRFLRGWADAIDKLTAKYNGR